MTNRIRARRPAWVAAGVALMVLALSGCGALLTPKYRIHRAEREMKAGQWQRAAVDLQAVVQKQPQNARAWLLLARLDFAAGNPNGAQASLAHAIRAGARGTQVNLLQASVWLITGHAKTLLAVLDQHKLALPEPQGTVLQAKALVATGQTTEALAALQPLLAKNAHLTEARLVYAEALAQQGKLSAAMQQLQSAARLDPQSPEPLLLEGRLDQWFGQFATAERVLVAALKHMPPAEPVLHRVSALIALTQSRLALGKVTAAARSQKRLAALDPSAPETRLLDARIKLAHRDLDGGINELEGVVADVPSFMQARLLLGAALMQRGDLEQAQQQLQDVVQHDSENIQARKLLAQIQLKLGEPQGALSVLTPALRASALDPQLLSLYGVAARRAGNSRALVHALERIVRERPADEAAKLNLAAVYLQSGQANSALALLQQTHDTGNLRRDRLLIVAVGAAHGASAASGEVEGLLHVHPRNPGILNLAATYYAGQGQLARAGGLLRQALAVKPNLDSLVELAGVEQAMGDSGAAVKRLRGVLVTHPQALQVRLVLAAILIDARHFTQARSVLEATGPHPGAAVSFGLARVALAQGDLTAAETALGRAIATQPRNPALAENAGLMLMQANQYGAALARFAQATQLEPDNATYWFNSARAQLALNQPLAARASLEKAEKAQPHWLPAISVLAQLDVREGRGQAALGRVDALLKDEPHNPGVLALKGLIEAALGQSEAAMVDISAAQRLRPSPQLAVQMYRLKLAAHTRDPQRPLEQWLAHKPRDWQVRDVLGDYYLSVPKSLPQAVSEFRQVIAVAPNDILALNNLAWALNRLGNPKAAAIAERAYHLAPQSPNVSDTLGWILARQGRSTAALPYLEHATQLSPQDPDMAYHYAYALAKAGQRTKARAVLTRALAGKAAFASRQAAEGLLASLKQS